MEEKTPVKTITAGKTLQITCPSEAKLNHKAGDVLINKNKQPVFVVTEVNGSSFSIGPLKNGNINSSYFCNSEELELSATVAIPESFNPKKQPFNGPIGFIAPIFPIWVSIAIIFVLSLPLIGWLIYKLYLKIKNHRYAQKLKSQKLLTPAQLIEKSITKFSAIDPENASIEDLKQIYSQANNSLRKRIEELCGFQAAHTTNNKFTKVFSKTLLKSQKKFSKESHKKLVEFFTYSNYWRFNNAKITKEAHDNLKDLFLLSVKNINSQLEIKSDSVKGRNKEALK